MGQKRPGPIWATAMTTFELLAEKERIPNKNGITGTYVDVILEHNYHHEHRNLEDVNKIIDNSSLDENVKDLSKRIFLRVAKAESKVHNKPLNEIHFHEVGAIDSIVDIVGTAILINKINS